MMLRRIGRALVTGASLVAALAAAEGRAGAAPDYRDPWRDVSVGMSAVYQMTMPQLSGPLTIHIEVTGMSATGARYRTSTTVPGLAQPQVQEQDHPWDTSDPTTAGGMTQLSEGTETIQAAGRSWDCHWVEYSTPGQSARLWYAQGVPPFMGAHAQYGGTVKLESAGTVGILHEWAGTFGSGGSGSTAGGSAGGSSGSGAASGTARDPGRDCRAGQFAVYEMRNPNMPNPMTMRYEVTSVEADALVYDMTTDMHMQGVPPQTMNGQRRPFADAAQASAGGGGGPAPQAQVTEGDETLTIGGQSVACHWIQTTASGQTSRVWYSTSAPAIMGGHPQHGGIVKTDAAGTTMTLSEWGPR